MADPQITYEDYRRRKASAMRRPRLSCGCVNKVGEPTYVRGCCDRITCEQHRDDEHDCDDLVDMDRLIEILAEADSCVAALCDCRTYHWQLPVEPLTKHRRVPWWRRWLG